MTLCDGERQRGRRSVLSLSNPSFTMRNCKLKTFQIFLILLFFLLVVCLHLFLFFFCEIFNLALDSHTKFISIQQEQHKKLEYAHLGDIQKGGNGYRSCDRIDNDG